jgi:antitoxin (DNA-binding transcriptional repressor) of toxin-antitoxin stability system
LPSGELWQQYFHHAQDLSRATSPGGEPVAVNSEGEPIARVRPRTPGEILCMMKIVGCEDRLRAGGFHRRMGGNGRHKVEMNSEGEPIARVRPRTYPYFKYLPYQLEDETERNP